MTDTTMTRWDPQAARTAGALYLAIAVCGGFSIGYVPLQIVGSDAASSGASLMAQQGLFRLGVLADCAVIWSELAITVILYHLFRDVGPRMAMVALVSRAAMIVVMGVNVLLWIMPYIMLTDQTGPVPQVTQALIQFCFDAHAMGVMVWQLFFGVHLLALGWLVLKSPHVPNILGHGMLIGAFGYLIQGADALTFTDIAALDYAVIALLVIVTFSEVGFGLWLLVRGGRKARHTALTTPAYS